MTSLLDIGPQLTVMRRARGMSQRELGVALGVKQQQIARWEATSYRTAALASIAAVADTLGVGSGELLAAEAPASYSTATVLADRSPATPVRDLGEISARVRSHSAEFVERGLSRIGVFGSFALGEQTPESDVDLLVEYGEEPSGFAYMAGPELAEDLLGRRVDWVKPRLLRPQLRDRVLSEVVYVWET